MNFVELVIPFDIPELKGAPWTSVIELELKQQVLLQLWELRRTYLICMEILSEKSIEF